MRILVLCTGNSARSQMAEGLFRRLGGERVVVSSAGTKPRPEVHPLAVKIMAEQDIDISAQRPKDVGQFVGEDFDYVITVCDRAKESCPVMPGARMLHWPLPDPAEAEPAVREQVFRDTARDLTHRIEQLLGETS